jgi:hypothetical protein
MTTPTPPLNPDQITLPEIAQAFTDMALLIDTFPCHLKAESKFEMIRGAPTSKESIFLLATYCFDLERRFGYLYRVLQQVANHAEPHRDLARRVKHDNDAINAPGINWEARAKAAHEAMLDIHNQVQADHKKRLLDAMEKGSESAY